MEESVVLVMMWTEGGKTTVYPCNLEIPLYYGCLLTSNEILCDPTGKDSCEAMEESVAIQIMCVTVLHRHSYLIVIFIDRSR